MQKLFVSHTIPTIKTDIAKSFWLDITHTPANYFDDKMFFHTDWMEKQ